MTRINTLKPTELSDQLVINELGEIGRVLLKVCERIDKDKPFDDIPHEYTLGSGHMKFFFPRCGFIMNRYLELRKEYTNRTGKTYSTVHLTEMTERMIKIRRFKPELWRNYVITPEARESCLKRIKDRSTGYKKHTYYGKEINWNKFLEL